MNRHLIAVLFVAVMTAPTFAQDFTAKAKAVLSKIDGEFKLPGLKEPVEVLRDKWGVPHIYAKNADDLFFAQGYVAAQDRLFQLDLWRRVARGEMAEVIGPDAIEADTFARLIRYRGDMKAEWQSYSPDTKEIATAFTSGVNAHIKECGDRLPIEFQILGYKPGMWRPEDILGRMSGIVMSRNMNDEVLRAHMIEKLGLDKVRMLMPTDVPHEFAPAPGVNLKGIDSRILKGYQAATKVLGFKPVKMESNNWVVSGDRSASGKPMLASDPHRAIANPALRYLVHLNAPGWNVIGAGEPALPGVALGHNEHIAWGITIVCTDQTDIYVEETDPKNPLLYKNGNDWKQFIMVGETIRVKGEKDREIIHKYTRHGPVIFQDRETNRAYALRWAGSDPGGAGYLAGLAVSRAKNWDEFQKALERWKIPALNFVYADRDGNIGWVAAGATPNRPKHDGLLPVPANSGYQWKGYLSVKDLPQVYNPQAGWVGTANHNIIPEGYKHTIGFDFAPPYRFERVKHHLEARPKHTLDDFKRAQHDEVSIPGQRLAKLMARYSTKDRDYSPYLELMKRWDGSLGSDSQAAVLFAYWVPILQQRIYSKHVPPDFVKEVAAKGGLPTLINVLERPRIEWLGGDEAGLTRDVLLLHSFYDAVDQAKTRFPKVEDMRWGKLHTVTFRHTLATRDPLYAKLMNVGPFERGGDANTPNNARYDATFQQIHGATYRHLFDLADWDKGLATSAPGQSGQFGSPHFADLAPLWAKGEYFPLAYSRKKVDEVTANRLLLTPGK